MALQKRRWQVHSAVTPKVRLRKQRKARARAVCAKIASGQLPFLGSNKGVHMHATTVTLDLAEFVFQIAFADEHWHIVAPNCAA
jgi:hypothetical protein